MNLRVGLFGLCVLAVSGAAGAAERGFGVDDMVRMERVSSPVLTPEGAKVIFVKREIDGGLEKASSSLWVRDLRTRDLRPPARLSPEGWNLNSPSISADGQSVYFLSAQSGLQQLYSMPVAGGVPQQLTAFALDVGSYQVSPDGNQLAFSAEVFLDCGADFACTQQRLDAVKAAPTSGVLYEGLFVRHWDTWADGRRNALFVADLSSGNAKGVSTARALSTSLEGDVPSKPFGDASEYTWAPDGKSVVASIRVAGKGEAWSTNFDLYRLDVAGNALPVNLTQGNLATDTGPVFSTDGNTLFYRAMKRAGFEADRLGVMALDVDSGDARELAPSWDRSADSVAVSADGLSLYVSAQELGEHPLFKMDIASGDIEKIVGEGTVSGAVVAGDRLAFTRNSLVSNDQVFVSQADGSGLRAITLSAAESLPDVAWGEFEQFNFKGWNNETVHGYVLKPWNYVEGQKYPVAFLIHGGPQGSFGNGWSYRWNPQTYAGQGYAVVMIDFHGSTGYGQAFTDAISQHWGDRPLEDLQKGWATAQQRYNFLNGDKACALGASYGGYMINWIAGNWNQPWQCLVNHDGVFDTRSMGYVTEELWFSEWENGGQPSENPEGYEKFNPVNHVANWHVPMLVVQGEKDYRVPLDQGLSTFTALQRKGIESQLLYFPDENHWVLQPHNSVLWHETVNSWLKQHIGQ